MPLSPRQLSHLLGLELNALKLVLEKLHSVVSIPADPDSGEAVAPYHMSLHEFLTSKDRAGEYFIDPSMMHAALARCCLQRISTFPSCTPPLFRGFRDCILSVSDYGTKCDVDNCMVMGYACRY